MMKAAKKLVVTKQENQLVTPEAVKWLGQNVNLDYPSWVIDKITEQLRSDANSKRDGRFGASSRGDCLRRQVFQYLGFPQRGGFDYQLHNIFHDGHWRHMRWQAMLLTAGVIDDIEVQYQKDSFSISMDGVNTEDGWLFELKGASYVPSEVPEKHMLQIHTYFAVSGIETCSYVVEDKRTQDWREWVVTPIDQYVNAVQEEMDDLESAVKDQRIPEALPACRQETGEVYKRCPYSHVCLSFVDGWVR